ncbi:MAG: DNA polymerase III subunit gamma/tau [Bdellovibrionota bacterium]
MSYLVLARKFRPQTFASIVGQEHITRALANAILWNRVPHALLFTGPRGVGKTTSARVFARALNCTGRAIPAASEVPADADSSKFVEPCGECSNCKEIARSSSIAVWEIDGASNNSVENVRELIDSLRSLPPPGSKYKIYIIDEVHMLSTAAFNALLKSLEEPPPNTIFIFATTEPHKIPDTVISRCQRHDFRRLPLTIITNTLRELAAAEGVQADDEVFEFIALKARGGMRDAQTMLDRLIAFCGEKASLELAQQLFGVVDSSFFFRLSDAIFKQDADVCFELLDEAFSQSLDVRAFATDFVVHFRNLLLLSMTHRSSRLGESKLLRLLEVSKRDFEQLMRQVETVESFDLQRLFDIAEKTAEGALRSEYSRFVFEAGVMKMASLPSLRPLAEIVSALESGGSGRPPGGGGGGKPRPTAPAPASTARPSAPVPTAQVAPASVAAAPAATAPISPEPEAEPEYRPLESFNPSWQDFINYLKGTRNEQIIAAVLRRASPLVFSAGKLTAEAAKFDVEMLKDTQTFASLKSCLQGYSGVAEWEIRLNVHEAAAPQGAERPAAKKAPGVEKKGLLVPPGSMVALEAEADRKRTLQVDGEARNEPLVKAALSMFEGSTIEKVSIIKEGNN